MEELITATPLVMFKGEVVTIGLIEITSVKS